jgi:hypothetical protein
MTNEDITKELTDLKITIQGYSARVDAQNIITNNRLQTIDEKLCKQNGRVGKLEDESIKRNEVVQEFHSFKESYKDVPQQIRKLEDSNLSSASIKRWFAAAIALTGTIVGIVVTVLNFIMKAN